MHLRRSRGLIALAFIAGVAPGSALAAGPPAITSAGIDSNDRLYARWVLAPGTTFAFLSFATSPAPDDRPSPTFDNENVVARGCAPPPANCTLSPTSIAARLTKRKPRDRRYFVKVSALVVGVTPVQYVTSEVWVIDEAKPLIPGTPGPPPAQSTGRPATGRPLAEAIEPLPSLINYGFRYRGRTTVFTKLLVEPALIGSTIRITCDGHGCPFESSTREVTKTDPRHKLSSLTDEGLRNGTKIEISVTRPGNLGILQRFTIRYDRSPRATTRCLTAGTDRPISCPL